MSKEVKSPEPSEQTITIPLKKPIKWGQETITEVVLQPLVGRHIRGISAKPSLDELMKVASRASGLPDKVFDLMSAKDVLAVSEAVGEAL